MIEGQSDPSTRSRLLEAAWRCLCELGVEATTSRAITDRAGVNLAAITYYFGSKETLIGEAIDRQVERIVTPALSALQTTEGDPVSRMLTAVAHLQDAYRRVGDEAPAVLEAILVATRLPAAAAELHAFFARLRQLVADQISDQAAADSLPPWVDPHAMAGALIAIAQGIVAQRASDPEGPSHEAMAAQIAQLLIAAQLAPGSAARRQSRSRSAAVAKR